MDCLTLVIDRFWGQNFQWGQQSFCMSESCFVLEKTRSEALKKILTKVKDCIAAKKIPQAKINIRGLTSKQFTFTISPIWPLYKQIKDLAAEVQEPMTPTLQFSTPSLETTHFRSYEYCDEKSESLLFNLLGIRLKELRASQNEVAFGSEVSAPAQICQIADSLMSSFKIYSGDDYDLMPDIIRNSSVYFLDGKYYSTEQIPHSFVSKKYNLSEEFMKREYQKVLKRCQFLRWRQNILETSEPTEKYKAKGESDSPTASTDRSNDRSRPLHQKGYSSKPRTVNKQLTISKSQPHQMFSRFYLKFVKEAKRLREDNSMFNLTLCIHHKDRTHSPMEEVRLDMQFDSSVTGAYELSERIKREFRVYNIKCPPSRFTLKGQEGKGNREFLEREFMCKVIQEEICVMPQEQERLKEFLGTPEEKKVERKLEQSTILEIHEHQLSKVLLDKSLAKTLKIHYKFSSVKQVGEDGLELMMGERCVRVERVLRYEKRGSKSKRKAPKFVIPYVFDNIFEETGQLGEYLEKVEQVVHLNEPVIEYHKEKIKGREELKSYLAQIIELIRKCQDGCQIVIVANDCSIIRALREEIEESSSKCQVKRVAVEYSNSIEMEKPENSSVLEDIKHSISRKIHSHNDLRKISQLKNLDLQSVCEEVAESGATVRESRILWNTDHQFQQLINYINLR